MSSNSSHLYLIRLLFLQTVGVKHETDSDFRISLSQCSNSFLWGAIIAQIGDAIGPLVADVDR